MKRFCVAAILIATLTLPLQAKNFAVPEKDPAATLSIPNSWKTDEIEYGYNAMSPDKEIFFSVEYASSKKLDAMLKNNKDWMKENEIDGSVTPQKAEIKINGIDTTAFVFDTTDSNGKTIVEFYMMPGGRDRVIMLTLWGSDAERTKHAKEIESIMTSVRPIQ